jgi:predicted nucleotidyltransferase
MNRDDVLDTLSIFLDQERQEYGIVRLGVFGSAARDEISDFSGVDIVVEIVKPDLLTLVGIKQNLEERLHRPVDIVRYRGSMNAFLKTRIDQEAVYV